jgi:hypothetical protein
MLWIFVIKVEGEKQLHFSEFDEGFYDLVGETVHSSIDLGDSGFKILGSRLFERGS